MIGWYHSWRLKIAKSAWKLADNSTCLHSDSFEINKGKFQNIKSALVARVIEKPSYLYSDKKPSKHISEESDPWIEVL